MPPRKRRRAFEAAPPEPPPETTSDPSAWTLPDDLLLEIVARTDTATLFRFAACCRSLRRDIRSPALIRRVCDDDAAAGGIVPPCILGFLHAYDKEIGDTAALRPFSLAHPMTPAAASFSDEHLAPFLSRRPAADLLGRYAPLTSRHGLVVLRRRRHARRRRVRRWDVCVYDPMTGSRAFFPCPPDVGQRASACTYALLTAADDGITGCSFLLLAADISTHADGSRYVRVQTVSSSGGAAADGRWGPVAIARHPGPEWSDGFHGGYGVPQGEVVLGGLVHWVMSDEHNCRHHILTYDVATATAGSIKLPAPCGKSNLLLATPDGKLNFLVSYKLKISVWLLTADAVWVQHAVIDMEPTLPALVPEVPQSRWSSIDFAGSGARSGAVLLRPFVGSWTYPEKLECETRLIVLDLEVERKEMRRVNMECEIVGFPYEVDLASRLSAMKTFC